MHNFPLCKMISGRFSYESEKIPTMWQVMVVLFWIWGITFFAHPVRICLSAVVTCTASLHQHYANRRAAKCRTMIIIWNIRWKYMTIQEWMSQTENRQFSVATTALLKVDFRSQGHNQVPDFHSTISYRLYFKAGKSDCDSTPPQWSGPCAKA